MFDNLSLVSSLLSLLVGIAALLHNSVSVVSPQASSLSTLCCHVVTQLDNGIPYLCLVGQERVLERRRQERDARQRELAEEKARDEEKAIVARAAAMARIKKLAVERAKKELM